MAIIKPFKGIRPPKELVEKVESRPYDVLNSEEARAEAGDNEMSLYHIIKPEIDFPVGTSEYDPRVYEKAAENFQKFQDKGWLVQDEKEQYYIYAQTMNGKTQYGLVVCAHTDDYMAGRIKKHELTRRDKEEDRMKHVRVNNANIETASVISSGLSLMIRIFRLLPKSSQKCLLCISQMDTIVVLLLLLLAQRNRNRMPIIKEPKNIIFSWQYASRLLNLLFSITTGL